MSAASRRADPVEDYVAHLAAALHGPVRDKARLIEEIRGGLEDTIAARAGAGAPHPHAVRQALREFGTVEEVVPDCQRELTLAQARHTARAVTLTAPVLIASWLLLVGGAGLGQDRPLPLTAQLLAVHLTGAAAGAALLAAATLLALTGALARWLPVPRRLPLLVTWTGTTASTALALATLTLATASPLAANWPLLGGAAALTAASHGVVAASTRACRRCARLPAPAARSPREPVAA